MPLKNFTTVRRVSLILGLVIFILAGMSIIFVQLNSTPAQAAQWDRPANAPRPELAIPPAQGAGCYCSSDIYECYNFNTKDEAQACLDYCKSVGRGDVHGLDIDNDGLACESLPAMPTPIQSTGQTTYVDPLLKDPVFRTLYNATNLIVNGSFEEGAYPVGELGFEPPETGQVPLNWRWYRNEAYGKYNIYTNENFTISCPDDLKNSIFGAFGLSLHMQSTDQPDAHLGIYQTMTVIPGQSYLFVLSGTIQAQPGASSPDINNRVRIGIDHRGGTDWWATPEQNWLPLPWREQELEFDSTGPDDPDLAKVESYFTVVRARSNRMTIFIDAWRRWPNWRTTIFTVDCATLAPLNEIDVGVIAPVLSRFSTTAVDAALRGAPAVPAPVATGAAALPISGQAEAIPAALQPPEVPSAGGILDTKSNWILFTLASVVVILGLVGAGVWNARRNRKYVYRCVAHAARKCNAPYSV
ncbi:MAG: hypothetical protein U0401_22690 [Anaerolineae bacterium]